MSAPSREAVEFVRDWCGRTTFYLSPAEYTDLATRFDAFAARAVAAEREENAKIADDYNDADHDGERFIPNTAMKIASAIRSRSAAKGGA